MEQKEQTVTMTREEWWIVDAALLLFKRNDKESGEFWAKMARSCENREEAAQYIQFALDREKSVREIGRVMEKIKEGQYEDH